MQLTKRDLGGLIGALDVAEATMKSLIDTSIPLTGRRDWTDEDKENYREWTRQLKVFRGLRKRLAIAEATGFFA